MEQTKASELEDGVDYISNLSDHILISILSRIPTTEEINRTSILSTRWRYLWTSVPFIDIHSLREMKLVDVNSNRFEEFVDWVLASKSVDLDRFQLYCSDFYSMSTLGRWIQMAVTKKVKVLDLAFCPRNKSEYGTLPHCLVTCSSLVELRLYLQGRRLRLPNFTGFSALRVLLLSTVELSNVSSVKYFFEKCPVLEDLQLIDCFIHKLDILHVSCPKLKFLTIKFQERVGHEAFYKGKGTCCSLQISCPKLVYLNLTGPVASVISCKNLYSLKTAMIHSVIRPQELDDDDEERPLIDGFAGISHVEFLSISLYCVAKCYFPTEDVPVSLPNLKALVLITDAFSMDLLIPFLKCFPDLECLHLFITRVDRLEDWKLDDVAAMRILTRRLKLVDFLGFDGDERKLALARALLENGNALDDMIFVWYSQDEHHEKSLEAVREISNFHKASSTVKFRSVIESARS